MHIITSDTESVCAFLYLHNIRKNETFSFSLIWVIVIVIICFLPLILIIFTTGNYAQFFN